ncbi:MAG: hypothetical protein IT463_10780 [Planctomycetes bacterium]|nr:hypothetical protein [Planctomycetota bacterium]
MNRGSDDHCPACLRPIAGDGDRCIFCGAGLRREAVTTWRSVYHPHSYADAVLAACALRSHGLTARLSIGSADRALTGCTAGVVQVAEGEHLQAQEVVWQLRGVRTDAEYREWQQIKHGRAARRGMLVAALAALAAVGAAAGFAALTGPETEPAAEDRARP